MCSWFLIFYFLSFRYASRMAADIAFNVYVYLALYKHDMFLDLVLSIAAIASFEHQYVSSSNRHVASMRYSNTVQIFFFSTFKRMWFREFICILLLICNLQTLAMPQHIRVMNIYIFRKFLNCRQTLSIFCCWKIEGKERANIFSK